MNITESIIRTIEKDGIVLADRQDVYNSFESAIEEGRFEFIPQNGKNIGFFTYELQGKDIFINNLFIDRKHRGHFPRMWGIRFLKSKYPSVGALTWKNRKKNKLIEFPQKRMSLCCSQS